MRVIPIKCAAVPRLEIVGIRFTWADQTHARAVVPCIDAEPVPVRDRWRIESIDELDLHPLGATHDERWIDVIATFVLCAICDRAVHDTGRQSPRGAGGQRNQLAARRESSQIAAVA